MTAGDNRVKKVSFVSISEASRILGVSEAALRQWTDEGKIKAFVTPGGHRRYSRTDLEKLRNSSRKMLGIKDLAAELKGTSQAHRQISTSLLSGNTGSHRLDSESQEDLAAVGKLLLRLIVEYVTANSEKGNLVFSIQEAGRSLGTILARAGLPLTDAVEAFVLHRGPFTEIIARMLLQKGTVTEQAAARMPLVEKALDAALVSLVSAHQQFYCNSDKSLQGEG